MVFKYLYGRGPTEALVVEFATNLKLWVEYSFEEHLLHDAIRGLFIYLTSCLLFIYLMVLF